MCNVLKRKIVPSGRTIDSCSEHVSCDACELFPWLNNEMPISKLLFVSAACPILIKF